MCLETKCFLAKVIKREPLSAILLSLLKIYRIHVLIFLHPSGAFDVFCVRSAAFLVELWDGARAAHGRGKSRGYSQCFKLML